MTTPIAARLADTLRKQLATWGLNYEGTVPLFRIREAIDKMLSDFAASEARGGKFQIGDRVRKTKGSQWNGKVVGTYSTELTPEGYCVESERETGSVQLYPSAALEKAPNE